VKIIFLHIPKTAGQSIHKALVSVFGDHVICPARVNDQLCGLSISELNRYQVFSGHLDWSLLDCIKGPKYVFTVLRQPMDRILSFYFFLRHEGQNLTPEERNKPERQGLKAALELTPKEYFLGGAPHLRHFLDDHYDNFYTYYFAGRSYESRGKMLGLIQRGELSVERVLKVAMDNLLLLDDVFTVDNLAKVLSAIRDLGGKDLGPADEYRINVNTKVVAENRLSRIQELGADSATMERLEEYCSLDNKLWKHFSEKLI